MINDNDTVTMMMNELGKKVMFTDKVLDISWFGSTLLSLRGICRVSSGGVAQVTFTRPCDNTQKRAWNKKTKHNEAERGNTNTQHHQKNHTVRLSSLKGRRHYYAKGR